jgi:hypothetical protein
MSPALANGILNLNFAGRARHSVRAVVCLAKFGAHGVTRPTNVHLEPRNTFNAGSFQSRRDK